MKGAALPACSKLPIATGIGLRAAHHERVSAERPAIAWLEVHTENFLGGGATPALLESLRGRYAISLHGVGLSLGSADGLDEDHLARIAALVRRIEPAAISDHVSWSVTGGVYFNDLLPIPYDEEALAVIARNVTQFQEAVGRPVMVENPSTYLRHAQSNLAEPQFLAELCRRSGCGLLLDVNNVFVSTENHGDDARAYLAAIAGSPVGEIHLSGHHLRQIGNRSIRIDDHGSPVSDQVWALYEHALSLIGPRPTLIEWDSALPPLEILLAEAGKAQARLENAKEGRGMKLAQLQAAYRDYLLTGDSAKLAPAIVADAFDAAERLAIYRNNFLISLGEALKVNFPVTLQLLGGDFFEQAARRFILAHPPEQPCLFEYGAGFPDYLRDLPQLDAMPYVAEMARFEFARIAGYNAPTESYLSADRLAGLSPEQLEAIPIRLARHVQIVSVRAPVLELWQAHQKPEPDLAGLDMTARPHDLLVCRPDRLLIMREVDGPVARFLSAAQADTRLGVAAAQSGASYDAALGAIISLALELRLLATLANAKPARVGVSDAVSK